MLSADEVTSVMTPLSGRVRGLGGTFRRQLKEHRHRGVRRGVIVTARATVVDADAVPGEIAFPGQCGDHPLASAVVQVGADHHDHVVADRDLQAIGNEPLGAQGSPGLRGGQTGSS